MGKLTDDMTRLRGEVDALRGNRGALMQDLARGAKDLATEVLAMQASFAKAHTAMAKKTRRELSSFVSGIEKQVGRMRKETAKDLAGARRAWCI
jgi:hypothetical protein